jgi:hypothetical protein
MRNALMALAGAFSLLAAFGTATVAQAATPSTTLRAAAPSTSCPDTMLFLDKGTPSRMYGYQDSSGNLAFAGTASQETTYCEFASPNGTLQFWPAGVDKCLAFNSATGLIDEDSAAECNSNNENGQLWDQWVLIFTANLSHFIVENQDNLDCVYDDTQSQAITAGCDTGDHFEWMG